MNKLSEYHKKFDVFDSQASFSKVEHLFPDGQKLKVLDIGCGSGNIGGYLADEGNFVWGLDINEDALKLSRDKGIKASLWDINKVWPYANNFFDVVIAVDLLEHLYDWDFIFQEAYRVLKTGGSFLILTPNHFDIQNRMNILIGKGIVHWSRKKDTSSSLSYSHVRFPLLDDILDLAKDHGLYPNTIVYNFMSGKYPPAFFAPFFFKKFLLKIVPRLYSGKFGISFKKEQSPINFVYLLSTPRGY